MLARPDAIGEAWQSLSRALGGFGLAAVLGVVLGVAMGRSALVAALLDPLLSGTYPIPKIALFPIFVFAPSGPTLKGTIELLEKVKELGAETIVISSETPALKMASRQIRIPERGAELLSPIPYIIPAQLFAALLAEAKGLTPDQPRSLSKVTKTV